MTNPNLDRALADVEQALTGWRMGKVILEDDDSLFKIPHPRVQAWLRALAAAVRDLQAERDALREQVAEAHDQCVLAYGTNEKLREQVAQHEEAAFMAGWIDGNSEVVHGPTWTYSQESQQRDAAFLRWQARQKGTPT